MSTIDRSRVVRVEVHGDIALLRLNRPEVHNVVDFAVIEQWEAILDELDSDRTTRFLIITGAGNRSFCAGGDLKYFRTLRRREA